ncbi:MAG: hypothetical protein LCH82_09285 [Actinobacteria bacterium]|nr:hypothetical protein [Tetrasphaera australiensis]MCA0291812.1 hypothetical protein [Actinomycetota bacterium]
MPNSRGMPRSRLLPLLTVLGLAGVTGCGDPPPAADVAPVEVVLPGCTLNRDSVAVGTHEFSAAGTGYVVVTGADSTVLAEFAAPTTTPASVTLTASGPLTVTCRAAKDADSGATATLTVNAGN